MDGRPRPTSGCPSVLRLPDVHKESETPSTSGEGERKFTESSLVYSIPDFPAGANFCRIFLQPQEVGHCRRLFRNFCKKNKPCKDAQPEDAPWKKLLLSHIKYNIKCVKFQAPIYTYSISDFPPNATAKPQNLPAVHYLGDVCIHTTKAYLQSTVAFRVIVVRGLVNPPRLIRFREYRRVFQSPHELSFMPATVGRSGYLTTDTAQTQ